MAAHKWVNDACSCGATRTKRATKSMKLVVIDNAFTWQRTAGYVFEKNGIKSVTAPLHE